jgi:Endosomal/lysosomal potassium channel TMEM175
VTTSYNQIAGRSVERLAALSDGIFAVAMTLLVLDLRLPATEAIHGEHDLWRALVALAPRLLVYMMSFLTLGIFWVGQQTQLSHLARSDRSLTWIHILFLFGVSLTPFSTMLLGEHTGLRIALLVYWANILLLGPGEGRPAVGGACGHQAADRNRAGALCGRGAAVRGQHVLEHRVHRPGAAQLRDRATLAPDVICTLPATIPASFPLESIELLPAFIRTEPQTSRAGVRRSAGWKTPKPWLHW